MLLLINNLFKAGIILMNLGVTTLALIQRRNTIGFTNTPVSIYVKTPREMTWV